jgi:hypothetical protein
MYSRVKLAPNSISQSALLTLARVEAQLWEIIAGSGNFAWVIHSTHLIWLVLGIGFGFWGIAIRFILFLLLDAHRVKIYELIDIKRESKSIINSASDVGGYTKECYHWHSTVSCGKFTSSAAPSSRS